MLLERNESRKNEGMQPSSSMSSAGDLCSCGASVVESSDSVKILEYSREY